MRSGLPVLLVMVANGVLYRYFLPFGLGGAE